MTKDLTNQRGSTMVEAAPPKLQRPPLYKVVLLNDDYTPMEFVVHILQKFFCLQNEDAVRVMMEVHTQGAGVAGTFTAEIAETKVAQVNRCARENQHPLMCTMERA
jgi:ATP-dependent Clp protease adaptor protein ClpS